jgi:osmotically-inducible protein OsmY
MKHAILVAAAVWCVSVASLQAQTGNDAGTQTQQSQSELSNTNAFGVNTNSSSGVSEPAGASTSDAQTQSDSSRTVLEPSGAERKVGTIILQGTVETIEQRTAVEQAIRQLPGVTDVKNRITLTGQVKEPAGATTDPGLQGTSPESTSPSTGSTNNLDQPQISTPQTPQP